MKRHNDCSSSACSSRPRSLTFSQLTANGKRANCKLNVAWRRGSVWGTVAESRRLTSTKKSCWSSIFFLSSWCGNNLQGRGEGVHQLEILIFLFSCGSEGSGEMSLQQSSAVLSVSVFCVSIHSLADMEPLGWILTLSTLFTQSTSQSLQACCC